MKKTILRGGAAGAKPCIQRRSNRAGRSCSVGASGAGRGAQLRLHATAAVELARLFTLGRAAA
jgi:hypothetical protein